MIRPAVLALSLLTATLPVAADTYPRQRGVDIENYRFELTLSDETDEIQGATTVTSTYFTTLFVEHAYGRDEMVKLLEAGRDRIFDMAEENPDHKIVHDNLDDMSRVTSGTIYQKGGWTLHMLRELIGDEAFWTGIRKYYARHQNGNATTSDFRTAMEEASVRDLAWFFDQWLHRVGALEIDGVWSWAQGDRVLGVTLDQVQPDGLPYRTPLDLEITDAQGGTQIVEVDLEALRQEFAIELESEPVSVVLDPGLKVLGRWTVQRR